MATLQRVAIALELEMTGMHVTSISTIAKLVSITLSNRLIHSSTKYCYLLGNCTQLT